MLCVTCDSSCRFRMAHAWDKKYTIPHIYWDTLPRASASQVHPHFHVTLARDHYYGRWWCCYPLVVHPVTGHFAPVT